MTEITDIPLTDSQLAGLAKMHVSMFHSNGTSFVSRRYWEETSDAMRLGLTAMLAPHLLSEMIRHVEAKRAAEGQEAASE